MFSYDEHYQRRGPYGKDQIHEERRWQILENTWLPERSDHPLESEPTNWNLAEIKRSQSQCLQRERTMPNLRFVVAVDVFFNSNTHRFF